jgi:alpha-N-arabinofuranosidase
MNKSKIIPFLIILCFCVFNSQGQIKNPILPGFYPDPSICRVNKDYYLVTSSFSYFPGVPIFHSTDLAHWKQIGHVLNRPSQLNLIGQGISDGIFAPTIRYHKGIFYMITTASSGIGNFFVTAKNPAGPWSDPILLNDIMGIDPSIFFDDNGKAYITNCGPGPHNPKGWDANCAIWLQELDLKSQKCVGPRKAIRTALDSITKISTWIESPHIYKKKGYYYLVAAEGGTGIDHAVTVYRSKNIWGPYKAGLENPILTQRYLSADRLNPITCAGHADFVQTPDKQWVSVFLACQPYSEDYYNIGRQTFFLPVNWNDEWPTLLAKDKVVPIEVRSPLKKEKGKIAFADYSANWRDDFDTPNLKFDWNFIRTPNEKWYELLDKNLVIHAKSVPISEVGNPSFIGRRLQHINAEMSTAIQLESKKEMEAGLIAFQNEKYFYKFVVCNESDRYCISLASATNEIAKVELKGYKVENMIYLKIISLGSEFKCEYSMDNINWSSFGPVLDGKMLSTHVAGGFTGTYLGLYAYAKKPAKALFDWASYKQLF